MDIKLKNVSLNMSARRVLDDISLDAKEPRIGVIGANGSGKSSLARLLTGLLKPDSGTLRICGVDVWEDRAAALRTVGLIFQNPDHQIIFPTCLEEVAFGLRQMGRSKQDADSDALAFLQRYGRAHWAERPTQNLSQGQRHFLCLISILAMAPKLLVLDEPYAGLDLATSLQLHRALEGLDQQLVLITHDLEVLRQFERVIWLDAGRIVEDGAPDQVIKAYRTEMQTRGAENV